jgi:hypothetical protein
MPLSRRPPTLWSPAAACEECPNGSRCSQLPNCQARIALGVERFCQTPVAASQLPSCGILVLSPRNPSLCGTFRLMLAGCALRFAPALPQSMSGDWATPATRRQGLDWASEGPCTWYMALLFCAPCAGHTGHCAARKSEIIADLRFGQTRLAWALRNPGKAPYIIGNQAMAGAPDMLLFRLIDGTGQLMNHRLVPRNPLPVIKRRAKIVTLRDHICRYIVGEGGVTNDLDNVGLPNRSWPTSRPGRRSSATAPAMKSAWTRLKRSELDVTISFQRDLVSGVSAANGHKWALKPSELDLQLASPNSSSKALRHRKAPYRSIGIRNRR